MPYRVYLTWIAWLREQYNNPDRHDYYIMQLTAATLKSDKPASTFKIEFNTDDSNQQQEKVPSWVGKPMNELTPEEMREARMIGTKKYAGLKDMVSGVLGLDPSTLRDKGEGETITVSSQKVKNPKPGKGDRNE